ncbi:MAG: hypothetical protein ABFS09_09140 [Thermodesulfobacteriota bacterium]
MMSLFHGPEKRLEIQLADHGSDLLSFDLKIWQGFVQAAGAQIIDTCHAPGITSFLLSESSLFIWSKRLVLLTCGKTSPLPALAHLLAEVDQQEVTFFRYEEKALAREHFCYPDFREILAPAATYFTDIELASQGKGDGDRIFHGQSGASKRAPCSQLLCHGLSAQAASFFSAPHKQGQQAMELVERASSHQHWFSPQGYSENGIIADNYYALHATPQGDRSYGGFETDLDLAEYPQLVDRLLSLFEPKRFTFFAAEKP